MRTVVQLVRVLESRPELPVVDGIELRHYAGPEDVDIWLDIRRRAFARQQVGVRDWTRVEFEHEFTARPWWGPEALWFARTTGQPELAPRDVGTVALGWRGPAEAGTPVIHWLAVLPRERRRGIGRLLVRHLEQLVWDRGGRELRLETHAAWSEAGALYRALGYREA